MSSEKKSKDEEDEDLVKKNWRPYAAEYDPIKVASINGIGTFPHDNAVVRAIESKYKPGPNIPEKSSLKKTIILVAKLAPLVSEEELKTLFSKYGKVINVNVIRDIVTRRSKGYGFVEFEKERHCDRALRNTSDIVLAGNTLVIDKARSKTMPGFKPRRLGGGFGGSRDSGQLRFGCKARPWLRPLFKSERRQRYGLNSVSKSSTKSVVSEKETRSKHSKR